jgi:hypothetical protein
MFRDFIKTTDGFQIILVINTMFFFLLFAAIIIRYLFVKKDVMNELSRLPFNSDEELFCDVVNKKKSK